MAVMEAIKTVYMEADATTLTVSGIPSTYEHLQIRGSMRSTSAGDSSVEMWLAVNGDTSANSCSQQMFFNATTLTGLTTNNDVYIRFGNTVGASGYNPGPFSPTFVIDIHDYAATDKGKTVLYQCGKSVMSAESLGIGGGYWNSTTAISSLKFYLSAGNILRGSVFSLYGFNEA